MKHIETTDTEDQVKQKLRENFTRMFIQLEDWVSANVETEYPEVTPNTIANHMLTKATESF